MTGKYVAGQGSGEAAEAEKAFVSLNWVLSEDVFDVETQLEWGFLDYLLLGTSAAPLRKVSSGGFAGSLPHEPSTGEAYRGNGRGVLLQRGSASSARSATDASCIGLACLHHSEQYVPLGDHLPGFHSMKKAHLS